jgi:hypothetical protein
MSRWCLYFLYLKVNRMVIGKNPTSLMLAVKCAWQIVENRVIIDFAYHVFNSRHKNNQFCGVFKNQIILLTR